MPWQFPICPSDRCDGSTGGLAPTDCTLESTLKGTQVQTLKCEKKNKTWQKYQKLKFKEIYTEN